MVLAEELRRLIVDLIFDRQTFLNSSRTNSFRSEPGESESRFSEHCVRATLKVHAEWLINQLPATKHEFEH